MTTLRESQSASIPKSSDNKQLEKEQEQDARRIINQFMQALDAHARNPLNSKNYTHGDTTQKSEQEEHSRGSIPGVFIIHARESSRTPSTAPADIESEARERRTFIPLFFADAPRTHGNNIIAERKTW